MKKEAEVIVEIFRKFLDKQDLGKLVEVKVDKQEQKQGCLVIKMPYAPTDEAEVFYKIPEMFMGYSILFDYPTDFRFM